MNQTNTTQSGRRVVIVGANFAGLTVALQLSTRFAVTVIDPQPHFEFTPNIHELISGVKSPRLLRLPKKRLLSAAGHGFVQEKAVVLEPSAHNVTTESGKSFEFDVCVVALGGVSNSSGVRGANTFALPFKSVQACEAIGEKLKNTVGRKPRSSVVVVGGGLIGIEALGEILRRYRNASGLTIYLVEQQDRLLPDEPAVLDREVRKVCRTYPVHFYTGASVVSMTADEIALDSGKILPSDLTIWAGGAKASPLLAEAGLAPEDGQWAPVQDTLQSRFFENIFVAGDAAQLPEPIVKQAYYAIQMGEQGAENVERCLAGRPLRNFRPSPMPKLISFGDLDTYLVQENKVIAGSALAAGKEGVFQVNMAKFDRPISPGLFFNFQERHLNGLLELALPALTSPFALMRLGNVRWLRD